jgi:nucleolar GTP-binding protein
MKEVRDDITRKRKLLKEAHHLRVKDDVKLHRPQVEEIRSNLGSKGVDTTFMEQRMIK